MFSLIKLLYRTVAGFRTQYEPVHWLKVNMTSAQTRARRLFYGWYIVAGAGVAFFIISTLNIFAPSVLMKPMIAELGWSRANFFAVQMLSLIISGIAAPFVGRRIDRGNPRLVILVGSAIMGGSVIAYSQVHSLWLYFLIGGVAAPLGLALCGMQVFNSIIGKWFVRKRGRALVTIGVGYNTAGIIASPAVVALIGWLGWRMTWVALGLALIALMAPAALLVRRSPEDMGLAPDGELRLEMNGPRLPLRREPEWQWRQLLRTRALWLISITLGLVQMAAGGSQLHLYPFLTDRGIVPALAATMISIGSISALVSRPLWGHVFDRWDPRYAVLMVVLTLGLSLVILVFVVGPAGPVSSMIVRGIAMGGGSVMATMLCSHYFGRRSLGQVLGLSHLISLVFSATAPFFAAWMFDLLHSYTLVFTIFAVACALCSIMVFLIRSPVAEANNIRATKPGTEA